MGLYLSQYLNRQYIFRAASRQALEPNQRRFLSKTASTLLFALEKKQHRERYSDKDLGAIPIDRRDCDSPEFSQFPPFFHDNLFPKRQHVKRVAQRFSHRDMRFYFRFGNWTD